MAAFMMKKKINNVEKSVRVVIVDDILQVRQELATVLYLAARSSHSKIEVVGEACNGLEAVDKVRSLHPDVVLMDLEMPGMDGYAATQAIKSTQPAIRVIVVTIHGGDHERFKAAQAGADGFIEKSTPIDELLQSIQYLGRTA